MFCRLLLIKLAVLAPPLVLVKHIRDDIMSTRHPLQGRATPWRSPMVRAQQTGQQSLDVRGRRT